MHSVGLWSRKRKPASTSRLCHTRPCHITLETRLVSSSINLPDRVVLRTRNKVKKEPSVTPASGKLRAHCSPNSDTGTYGRARRALSGSSPGGQQGLTGSREARGQLGWGMLSPTVPDRSLVHKLRAGPSSGRSGAGK